MGGRRKRVIMACWASIRASCRPSGGRDRGRGRRRDARRWRYALAGRGAISYVIPPTPGVTEVMIQTRQDWRTRWERPLAGGLSEVTSLSMPLRRGIWYAMVVHGR